MAKHHALIFARKYPLPHKIQPEINEAQSMLSAAKASGGDANAQRNQGALLGNGVGHDVIERLRLAAQRFNRISGFYR